MYDFIINRLLCQTTFYWNYSLFMIIIIKATSHEKLKIDNFEIYIADRKATTCIYAKLFMLCCINSAAVQLVRCYSFRPPRRVASWVNYNSRRTESSSEHFASDLRLLKADVLKADAQWCENRRCSDSNHDLRIRKRVCYPLHHVSHVSATWHVSHTRIIRCFWYYKSFYFSWKSFILVGHFFYWIRHTSAQYTVGLTGPR